MYCAACGAENGDGKFCRQCGMSLSVGGQLSPESGTADDAVVSGPPAGSGDAPAIKSSRSRNKILMVAAVAAGVLVVAGVAFAVVSLGHKSAPSNKTVNASANVTVPDLVKLGGRSEFSNDMVGISDEPRLYGDASRLKAYREIAKKAGVEVKFVVMGESDEAFGGGSAGWPIGQTPAPGETVARGSTVELVVIQAADAAVNEIDVAYSGTAITEPVKGSPARKQILDAIRSYDANAADLVFIVPRMRVMGDVAIVEVYPTAETDNGDFVRSIFFLKKQSDVWTAAFGIPADDAKVDQDFGPAQSVPSKLANDFFQVGSGLVRVPDMCDVPAIDALDIYASGYEARAAKVAADYLSEFGLKSDYKVNLGEFGTFKQTPEAGSMVPKGTVVHVKDYITG